MTSASKEKKKKKKKKKLEPVSAEDKGYFWGRSDSGVIATQNITYNCEIGKVL